MKPTANEKEKYFLVLQNSKLNLWTIFFMTSSTESSFHAFFFSALYYKKTFWLSCQKISFKSSGERRTIKKKKNHS